MSMYIVAFKSLILSFLCIWRITQSYAYSPYLQCFRIYFDFHRQDVGLHRDLVWHKDVTQEAIYVITVIKNSG